MHFQYHYHFDRGPPQIIVLQEKLNSEEHYTAVLEKLVKQPSFILSLLFEFNKV